MVLLDAFCPFSPFDNVHILLAHFAQYQSIQRNVKNINLIIRAQMEHAERTIARADLRTSRRGGKVYGRDAGWSVAGMRGGGAPESELEGNGDFATPKCSRRKSGK